MPASQSWLICYLESRFIQLIRKFSYTALRTEIDLSFFFVLRRFISNKIFVSLLRRTVNKTSILIDILLVTMK